MKHSINIAVLLMVLCGICVAQPLRDKADPVRELQAVLDNEVAATPSIPGELLHITSPRHRIDISLSAGLFDRQAGTKLEPDHVFRVASVTKTFVAASVLRLVEDDKVKLDDPISRHLDPEYVQILKDDGYDTEAITVRHLLSHTSGIYDYATDAKYYAAVFGDPGKRWTRTEQLRSAMEWGKPVFAPGRGFHYSDTGYILLGSMIERLTKKPLAAALRSILDFKKLGLSQTYLETLESAPAGVKALSHPYFGTLDAMRIDASHDLYGGGGLVSSTADLARFFRSLLRGKVFKRDSTLKSMMQTDENSTKGPDGTYTMGISRRSIGGIECWGHRGFWGTSAYHCPSIDLTIVRQLNQAQRARTFVFDDLYGKIFGVLEIASTGEKPR